MFVKDANVLCVGLALTGVVVAYKKNAGERNFMYRDEYTGLCLLSFYVVFATMIKISNYKIVIFAQQFLFVLQPSGLQQKHHDIMILGNHSMLIFDTDWRCISPCFNKNHPIVLK